MAVEPGCASIAVLALLALQPSTVYSITPAGREALAAWLAEPGAGPLLECEALVKIAYADQDTRAGLLANLDALVEDTTVKLRFGEMIARRYLARGPVRAGCHGRVQPDRGRR